MSVDKTGYYLITRNSQQGIRIEHAGEVLEILVVDTDRDRVRLGLKGPRSFQFTPEEDVGN